MKTLRHALFVLAVAFSTGLTASAATSNPVYTNTVKATVKVLPTGKSPGTGWVVNKEEKLILTTAKVVSGRSEVDLLFPKFDGKKVVTDKAGYQTAKTVKGRVVKVDAARDLALIEAASLPDTAAELPIATSLPESGDDVHCVSCPMLSTGFWVYSYGRVRQITVDHTQGEVQLVETQLPCNNGDAGAPIVNDNGEVVGIHRNRNEQGSLVSLSVCANEVQAFLGEPVKKVPPKVEEPRTSDDDTPEARRKSK